MPDASLAEGSARLDHAVEVTRDGNQRADADCDRAERRRRSGIRLQVVEFHVAEAERLAVRSDPVAASIDRRGEVECRGKADRFVDVLVAVGNVLVDRIEAVGQDADAANHGTALI